MAEAPAEHKGTTRWKRAAAYVLGALVLAVVLLYALVRMGAFNGMIAGLIEDALSDPATGTVATVNGLRGDPLSDAAIRGLTIAERGKVTVAAEQIELRWSHLRLLSGRVRVETLTAERLLLAAAPPGGPEQPLPTALPKLPVDVRLVRLKVDEIRFEGSPTVFTLVGAGRWTTDPAIEVRLALAPQDPDGEFIRLSVDYEPNENRLVLDGKLTSKSGGGLGDFLFPGESGDISLVLAGEGSVENWRGRLDGKRGNDVVAALDIAVTDRLRIDGMLDPRPFLPGTETTALIGAPRVTLDLKLKNGLPDTYTAGIVNDGANIRLAGSLADREAILSPRFSVVSSNAAWFAPVLGGWTFGRASLSGAVSQTGDGPNVQATMAVERLAGDGFAARKFSGDISLTASDAGGTLAYALTGKGAVEGIDAGERNLRADWMLDGRYDPGKEQISITDLRLSDNGSRIAAKGDVSLSPLSVKGSATVAVTEIGRWTGAGMRGGIAADGSFEWRPDRGRLMVKAKGSAKGLVLADARLSALLGPAPSFRLELDDPAGNGQGELDGAVTGAQVTASLKGRIGRTVDAVYEARFADVAALAGDGALEASGPLIVTGTLRGATDSPDVTLRTQLAQASLSGIAITDLALTAEATDLGGAPRGRIDAAFAMDGEKVTAEIPFLFDETGGWTADPIEVKGKSASLSGSLASASLGAPMTGRLDLRLSGRGVMSALAGMPASGSVEGAVILEPEEDVQGLRFDVAVAKASFATGDGSVATVARARLEGDVAIGDALDVRRITLDGTDITAGRAKLASLAATVTPSGGGLALTASAKGEFEGPLELSLQGRADRAILAAPNTITLDSLDGTFAGQKIALSAPATAVLAEDRTDIGPIRLSYNGAPLEMQATLRDSGSTARLSGRDLDLSVMSILTGGQDVAGKLTIDGQIDFSGGMPRGEANLQVKDLIVEDTLDQKPVDLKGSVTLAGGRVKGGLTVDTASERALDVALDLPVARGTKGPFALAVETDKPLALDIKGNAELAYLWPLTGAYEHIVGGRATVDARVTGSVANPTLNGDFAIAGLTYRNLSTGTQIEAANMRFVLKDSLLELPTTNATDGSKGSIVLSGWVRPLAPGGMQADITAQFTKARILKLRDMTARATGQIQYTQDKDGALLKGEAAINEAEYTLNAKASDDFVKLYVVELNRPPGLISLPEKPSERTFKTRLRIDVTAGNRIFVRGRGLDSEWSGKVRVRGTTDQLAMQGRIELVKGEFDFAGRRFVLQDGSRIELLGGTDLDPVITARAVYSVTSLTAEIALTGRASNPQIKLSSNPEMPQDEIISRVLFGQDKQNLSAFEAAQLAAAVASLGSSGSGFDVIGKLRGALTLDRLSVGTLDQPGADDEDNAGKPVIRGGKYITKNIYIEAGSATEEEDAQSVSVEIDLTKHLSVGTEATTTGNQKFKLQYKLDY
ncbi:translocation/assembly module TamB domain-containing protein [Emcibacter sp. SYSU 3D8]|uniref:translocation/assembly module TamB domain-containing protein n=1 Tax=Emcibacter sp. SYSU 3D8 TaxID=3133969 RepID=UPI0031FE5F14